MNTSIKPWFKLTGVYPDAALSTADKPAGPVLCYIRVRQLSLPAITRLARLGVETHFRNEWLGPLTAAWTVHQHHPGTPTTGLGLEGGKVRSLSPHYFTHSLYRYLIKHILN